MLIESLTMNESFGRFFQCVMTDEQIGNEIDQQQLPCGQLIVFLDPYCADKEESRNDDKHDTVSHAVVMVFVMMFVMVFMLMFMLLL